MLMFLYFLSIPWISVQVSFQLSVSVLSSICVCIPPFVEPWDIGKIFHESGDIVFHNLCDIGKSLHIRSSAKTNTPQTWKRMEFYLFIYLFFGKYLTLCYWRWETQECSWGSESWESRQKTCCSSHQHWLTEQRVKVNEADQLIQAYIKFPDHSNAHWSFGDLNMCVIPTDQSGFCPWVRHGDKYFLKDIREDWQDHTGAFRKLHFRTYNTNMYMNNYIY